MRPHDLTLFAAACIIALAGCSSNRAPAPEAPHAICVADLRDAGVIGRLGRPGGFEGVPLNYGAPWQAIGFHFNDEYFVLPNK